jgi:hypothetical protein
LNSESTQKTIWSAADPANYDTLSNPDKAIRSIMNVIHLYKCPCNLKDERISIFKNQGAMAVAGSTPHQEKIRFVVNRSYLDEKTKRNFEQPYRTKSLKYMIVFKVMNISRQSISDQ